MKINKFEKNSKKVSFFVFTVMLFLSVFAFEWFLSLLHPNVVLHGDNRSIRLRESIPSTISYLMPSDSYMENKDGLTQKKFRFEIDSDGYIYPSKVHLQADDKIMFLGGSTTECLYVEEKNRFPYLVGRLLETNGLKINTYNAGKSGNNSMHSINILLNKGLAIRPNIAVMMHNINDLTVLLYEKTYWNNNQSRSLIVSTRSSFLYEVKETLHSLLPRIYSLASNVFNRKSDEFGLLRGKKLVIDKKAILTSFEKSLLTFIAVAESNGLTPVLMTQANRFNKKLDVKLSKAWTLEKDFGVLYVDYKEVYDAMNELIRTTALSNNIELIDLERKIPKNSLYLYDFVHLNDQGSRYAARVIAEKIKPLLINKP